MKYLFEYLDNVAHLNHDFDDDFGDCFRDRLDRGVFDMEGMRSHNVPTMVACKNIFKQVDRRPLMWDGWRTILCVYHTEDLTFYV